MQEKNNLFYEIKNKLPYGIFTKVAKKANVSLTAVRLGYKHGNLKYISLINKELEKYLEIKNKHKELLDLVNNNGN